MSSYEFEGKRPQIAHSAFVHPEAIIIGGVRIDEGCYIGPGAILRGDWGNIVINAGSNVQENCVIHAAPDVTAVLGPASHIGHHATLHGCKLGEHVTVGMGAIIDEEVEIGDGCLIGAACLVPRGTVIPARKLVVGVPAKIRGDLTPELEEFNWWATRLYQALPARCHMGLKRIETENPA
jgi:carbonic anhydrase/acetyltransferase-like protein (isoleucine patch superfamily)